jgi:hypothetical protein
MSSPMQMFESQNKSDDDGAVIDSLLIETDAPPNLKDATEPIVVRALESPKKITRIISKDVYLDPAWVQPDLLLPADANRKSLNILVYSPTAVLTDGVRFSDEPGNIRTSGKIQHGDTIQFTDHTGPMYVLACGAGANGVASAAVSVEVWSVTE